MRNLTLLTDLYQLTMMAGYFGSGKTEQHSCFDLYFRRLPFGGGFCLAAGLQTALEYLEDLRFGEDELEYLSSLNIFSADFVTWLEDFRFQGDLWAVAEGTLVFPGEPLLRVEAPLPQAQLIESALLNIINFQTLVATKAARVVEAASGGTVLEFGLRRAQGIDGALAASRAAFLGGCHATSNTLAGSMYGIPVKGTHAHSWIMSFPSEIDAFRAYAHNFPTTCTLLVDTYDTLGSGVPNAIQIGNELREGGHTLAGIRLDSGDLGALSRSARKMLDDAGFTETKIVASNDLDEYQVARLLADGARIDIWGVGTNLVTCKDEPALGGVYKLAAAGPNPQKMEPRIKVSSNPIKTTVPGKKQTYRLLDENETPIGDVVCLSNESPPRDGEKLTTFSVSQNRWQEMRPAKVTPLLEKVIEEGRVRRDLPSLKEARDRSRKSLESLPLKYKTLERPASYWVGLSRPLWELRQSMLDSLA